MRKIGFIGIGTMGFPMVRNLHKAGYQVTSYNRSLEKLKPLQEEGIRVAYSLQEVVNGQDVVITMVSDDQAVTQLYTQEEGILSVSDGTTLLVDMSTVSPTTSALLAKEAEAEGKILLDAPVSGSSNAAESAQLVILVGGDRKAFRQLQDLFSVLGKKSYYFGESGSGAKAKLVINLFLGLTMQGLSEALVLAEKFSLDRETVLEMVEQSAVASPFVSLKKDSLLAEKYPVMFALKHMHKDLGLILQEAQKQRAVLPATASSYQAYTAAMNQDHGDEDLAAIFTELLAQSGVK